MKQSIDVNIEWQDSDYYRPGAKRQPKNAHMGWLKVEKVGRKLHIGVDTIKKYAAEYTDISCGVDPKILQKLVDYVLKRKKENLDKKMQKLIKEHNPNKKPYARTKAASGGTKNYEGFLTARQISKASGLCVACVYKRLKTRGIQPAFVDNVAYYKGSDYEKIVTNLATKKRPKGLKYKDRTKTEKVANPKKIDMYYHISIFKDGYWYVKHSGTLQEMLVEKSLYEFEDKQVKILPNKIGECKNERAASLLQK